MQQHSAAMVHTTIWQVKAPAAHTPSRPPPTPNPQHHTYTPLSPPHLAVVQFHVHVVPCLQAVGVGVGGQATTLLVGCLCVVVVGRGKKQIQRRRCATVLPVPTLLLLLQDAAGHHGHSTPPPLNLPHTYAHTSPTTTTNTHTLPSHPTPPVPGSTCRRPGRRRR